MPLKIDAVPEPNSKDLYPRINYMLLTTFSGPSAPPEDLELKDTTSTSILVGWNEVPDADKNGIIISYTVSYQAVTTTLVDNKTVYAPTREANLTGLIKNMNYSIRVLASTVKGNGNHSKAKFFITNQDGESACIFRFHQIIRESCT